MLMLILYHNPKIMVKKNTIFDRDDLMESKSSSLISKNSYPIIVSFNSKQEQLRSPLLNLFAISDRLSTGIAVADIDFAAIDAVRAKMPISQVSRNE